MDDEERAFQRRYGAWAPLDPHAAASLLAGFEAETWVVGGWAIEAFTHVAREHEGIDVAFFRRDVDALAAYLDPVHHAWAVGGEHTMLRSIDVERPGLPDWADQVWIREHATAPWLMDMPATPDDDGRWVSRRDPDCTASLDDVTWVADGVRYLNPEIVLAFKAKLDRPRDRADLDTTLPMLDDGAREWLRDTVARLHPGHAWLARLS